MSNVFVSQFTQIMVTYSGLLIACLFLLAWPIRSLFDPVRLSISIILGHESDKEM